MLTLARWCSTHRRSVVLAWIVVLIGVGAAWQALGSQYSSNFTLGRTDAQRAADLLKSRFPAQSGDVDQIVFKTRTGTLADARVRAAVTPMLAAVARLPHVTGVISPFDPKAGRRISKDGTIGFATVSFNQRANVLPVSAIKKVIALAESIRSGRLEVELGGQAIEQTQFAPPSTTTGIGVLAAIVVLLISFGSFLAMGLPIVTALFGLGTGIALIGLGTHVLGMPNFAIELAGMIGLGVGIDYSLFILTRFREIYRENGGDVPEAVALAMDTAGRAVLFAGATVVIALLGMFALGVSFLYGLAIAASLAVLLVLTASITLLPALLTFFGRRVGEPGRLARLFTRRRRPKGQRRGFWTRWIGVIQRHPALAATAATALMLTLAAPTLWLRLGSSDAGNDSASFTTRHAYDLLAAGFGPGFNGPLALVVKLPHAGDTAALRTIGAAVAQVADVSAVAPPRLSPSGDAAVINAYPGSSPESATTTKLVEHLRATVLPPIEASTGATVYVGGATATFIDFSSVLSSKLWLFIGIVVALSALLLLVVFRSLLIPLQAAVMNLFSIGASLGVCVAIFQFGWFPGISSGPIDAFVPVLMFAIVFGLSMDYEVFLVSRIHEEWMLQHDAGAAVHDGLIETGRVITAAAAVMVVVFASFILGGERVIELFGLGLASAVFLDALVIRCILLPAVLELLGARAWAFPSWLDRRLPRFAIEHDGPVPHAQLSRPAIEDI
ncbi:MAG TPA: MMPL family transporter [Gaiellaceae bacterium]|nr:MMPL family transporter [Gaiellaceae bacterium]